MLNFFLRFLINRSGESEQFDIYVNSSSGNDSNLGTSSSSALRTLTAAQTAAASFGNNVRIGLAAGSVWREQLLLNSSGANVTGATVAAYGNVQSLGLPVIRADETITGAWQNSVDRGDANTSVYSQVITWQSNSATYPAVWEDDVRLKAASSLANCQVTAGTFWTSSGVSQGASGIAATLYVHPFGSTAPTSKVFAYASRNYCLTLGNNSTARLIWTRRQTHADGALVGGTECLVDRCLLSEGVKHEALLNSGEYRDCIGWHGFDDPRTNHIGLEFYQSNASGLHALYTRCAFQGPPAGSTQVCEAFGGHSSALANQDYETCTLVDCSAFNAGLNNCGAKTYTATRCFADHTQFAVRPPASGAAGTQTLTDCMIRVADFVNNNSHMRGVEGASNLTVTGLRGTHPEGNSGLIFRPTAMTITKSILHQNSADFGIWFWGIRHDTTGNIDGMTQCIIVAGTGKNAWVSQTDPGAPVNNNAYSDLGIFTINTTNYTTLAALKAASLADSNSVEGTISIVDPVNNDWTVVGDLGSTGAGLERPSITYTTIPTTLVEAHAQILSTEEIDSGPFSSAFSTAFSGV